MATTHVSWVVDLWRPTLLLAWAVFLLFLTPWVVSARQAEQRAFGEVLDVHLFDLDVIVTDRAGRFLGGLTKDDFEVAVDGRPVAISNFAQVSVGHFEGAEESERAEEIRQPIHWAVFVDHRDPKPTFRKHVLREVEAFLSTSVREGDRGMVARFDGTRLRIALPLTSDRGRFLTAARGHSKEPLPQGASPMRSATVRSDLGRVTEVERRLVPVAKDFAFAIDPLIEADVSRTRNALHAFSDFLDLISGGDQRAVLIYVGPGFSPTPALPRVDLWRETFPAFVSEPWAPRPESREPLLRGDLERLIDHAAATRTLIYTVYTGDRHAALPDAGEVFSTTLSGEREHWTSIGYSHAMAEATGGQVFTSGVALTRRLAVVDRDARNYYSLAFSAAGPPGQQRAVRVGVRVPGATVKHRRSVRRRTAEEEIRSRLLSALVDTAAPSNPLHMSVSTGATRADPRRGMLLPMRIAAPLRHLTAFADGALLTATVTIHVAARTDDGALAVYDSRELALEFTAESLAVEPERPFHYDVELPVRAPGRLAVMVRDGGGVASLVTLPMTPSAGRAANRTGRATIRPDE